MKLSCLVIAALLLSTPTLAFAAPPAPNQANPPSQTRGQISGQISGQVRVAGTRAPIANAKVMIVEAPPDVRVGARARTRLDPASVGWIRRTHTDQTGDFSVDELSLGKIRVVVVAPGYQRFEVWAEVGAEVGAESSANADPLKLFLRPDSTNQYRTEVVSDRNPELPRPEHQIDGQRARYYPGSNGDPVRATQNLPGVARAPGGLGLVAVRGGDPRQTGIYVDGHPVPRGFHVLPIAAIIDPSMVDHVDLTPGNFDAAYGGFSGGLLEIHTRRLDDLQGVHGEAHVDLFDIGGAVRAPVGSGGVAFAFRRAHIGDIFKAVDGAIGKTGILVPNYWDYIGRFDVPVGRGHHLSIKAFGAADALHDTTRFAQGEELEIDFQTAFHRFDLGYAYEGQRMQASLSGAMLLDTNLQEHGYSTTSRRGQTASLRGAFNYRLARRATLLSGFDWVRTRAFRQSIWGSSQAEVHEYESKHWSFGTWMGVAFQLTPKTGRIVIRPQVRLNVFGTSTEEFASLDPRLDVRARVHPRVELFAAVGRYSAPYTVNRAGGLGLISSGETSTSNIVVPDWLIAYFDPGAALETPEGLLIITKTYQASIGAQIKLPWSLGLRATAFWRERPRQGRPLPFDPDAFIDISGNAFRSPRERAYGLELLLDRSLAPGVHGMLGYTLLRAQTTNNYHSLFGLLLDEGHFIPTSFDQRHNLVALLVFELPRGFRFGTRFRLTSGNPERPVIGTRIDQTTDGFGYAPIYGEFGSAYAPLFHQLDLRLDKTWYLRGASAIAYIDVQNVYNRMYPEIWIYSIDWSERGQRLGLPIFPSLGFRVEF